MPTAAQAIRAVILGQFLTKAGLPITRLFYDLENEVIRLEAAGGREFRIEIDQQGRARNV